MNTTLTAPRLHELLDYDANTGVLRWKAVSNVHSPIKIGAIAGCLCPDGYRRVWINRCSYPAHRLAWFYVTGRWPVRFIDHINGMRDENMIANLREATHSENVQNRRHAKAGTKTGLLGVSECGRKFRASIMAGGKKFDLGYFESAELAHRAYVEAKRHLHSSCTL